MIYPCKYKLVELVGGHPTKNIFREIIRYGKWWYMWGFHGRTATCKADRDNRISIALLIPNSFERMNTDSLESIDVELGPGDMVDDYTILKCDEEWLSVLNDRGDIRQLSVWKSVVYTMQRKARDDDEIWFGKRTEFTYEQWKEFHRDLMYG